MIGEHPRMIVGGGFGEWLPAFAYDLTGKELAAYVRSSGLVRYGKRPDGDEDTRPIGLPFNTQWNSNIWLPQSGAPALLTLTNLARGTANAFGSPNVTPNAAKSYLLPFNIGQNEGFSIQCYIYPKAKSQALRLEQWRWGTPGFGYVFQIRNGTPEIGKMSDEFNLTDLAALHVLWAVDDPSVEQKGQIDDLTYKLFLDFESLSFERALSRDDWYNTVWTISFIPEPRGVLHIVVAGADATTHENKTILETRKDGKLWGVTPVTLFSAGGGFYFQFGPLLFARSGKVQFGPFATAYFVDSLGDVSFAQNSFAEAGKTELTFQMLEFDGFEINFGFEAELKSLTRRQTPWLYGLSARLEPGERTISDEVAMDTDDLYESLDGVKETDPILDIEVSFDGPFNARTVKFTLQDVLGRTTTAARMIRDRLATGTIDDDPVITNGIIETVEQTNLLALAKLTGSTIRPDDQFTAGPDSELIVTVRDGWYNLAEIDCDPPPIGDNMHLSDAIRAMLRVGGFSGSWVAGVPVGQGKRLSRAALGEDWAERPDSDCKVSDAIQRLFESYGYGWKFYQDAHGIWQMVQRNATPVGDFSGDPTRLALFTEPGNLAIFRDISIIHDRRDFYNDFVVYWGKDGQFTKRYTDWGSILNPDAPNFIGRKKTYKLRNSGLATEDDADYALISLRWMYGRGGRRGQFPSFFHRRFTPFQTILADGINWEIEGISGSSWANNEMQFDLLEAMA